MLTRRRVTLTTVATIVALAMLLMAAPLAMAGQPTAPGVVDVGIKAESVLAATPLTGNPEADDDVPGVPIPASPFTGTIDETTDLDDVYRVKVRPWGTLKASISGPDGTDLRLYLYDSSTTSVKSPDAPYLAVAWRGAYPRVLTYVNRSAEAVTYYLDVHAYTGGGSYRVTYSVKPDKVGPVCGVKNVSVVRGRVCKIYFKTYDAISTKVTQQLIIKNRRGKIVKRWSWGYGENHDGWWMIKYRAKLAKGRYTIICKGKDLAGNRASKVGKATLRVR